LNPSKLVSEHRKRRLTLHQAALWPAVGMVLAVGSMLLSHRLSASEPFKAANPHERGKLRNNSANKDKAPETYKAAP
jgi:hypothetical protein